MRLSDILKDMQKYDQYQIIDEKDFDVLALASASIEKEFCTFLDSVKYIKDIGSNVRMILATEEVKNELLSLENRTFGICEIENPRLVYFSMHNFLSNASEYQYARKKFQTKIGGNCNIHPSAIISEDNVVIGDNVIIEEFVVIRENTCIGNDTIIRAGAKIGGMGFEFKRAEEGIVSVAHSGGVIIGNNVEIQYNTCIDRAVYPWDDTMIGDYVKIDNLVHIGHAVKVEENVMIVAQSGIGGRTIIHPNTWIGFSTTVSNGLEIGENSRVNIGAVVTKNVPDEGSVTGNFAIDHKKFLSNLKKSVL